MSRLQRHSLSIAAGLLLLAALLFTGLTQSRPAVDPIAWLLFTGLFLFADNFSFPIGGGFVNLSATAAVGGLLVMGPWAAAWIPLGGSLVNAGLRWAFPARLGEPREAGGWFPMLGIGLANAVLLTLSLLGGAALYRAAGGPLPLANLGPEVIAPYLLLVLGFSVINYILAAVYLLLPGDREALRTYVQALPNVILYEVAPQLFTPLLPLIYNRLGSGPFLFFEAGVAGASLVTRSLATTGQRLERRIAELKTLGTLSQALAASLQMDDLLATVREHLPKIMPVDGLYVALHHPESDEISFPLAVEKGQVLSWPNSSATNGLTEYVLRTRQPLLIPESVAKTVERLGLAPITRPAASWLGVPIVAGSQAMGVLGVYAVDAQAQHLTPADRDLLVTIATQLAVALHNARLYGQTDQALAQRVQQMSSILYTTAEGILLLDASTRVLTANRALAGFVGLPPSDLAGRTLSADDDLLARLGTARAELEADLAELQNGTDLVKHAHTTSTAPAQREVERTLVPVRGGSGDVAGWLMILRDVTEERALGQLRDDLTHMLIHDLRGPLGSILTSLSLIQQMAPAGAPLDAAAIEVLNLARNSGQHLLYMITELLDIARIESGAVPLQRQSVAPAGLLAAAAERLRPAAEAAAIQLVVEAAPGLPDVAIDLDLVRRVLDNLGDNAIKFSPNGTTLRLWTQPGATPGSVLFGFSDQGPGVPADAQKHMFEKFYRLPNIQGRRNGTGLGLAFCRLVVEAHGGEVWVESAPGQGSTFAISLPRA